MSALIVSGHEIVCQKCTSLRVNRAKNCSFGVIWHSDQGRKLLKYNDLIAHWCNYELGGRMFESCRVRHIFPG